MDRGKIHLPIGITDFKEIRGNGYHYIDKTASIKEIIGGRTIASLMIRPRGFGKTLLLETMKAFLDVREDNRALFEGLAVMDDEDFVEEWMNKYPVIHISFKDVGGSTFGQAMEALRHELKSLYESYSFIEEHIEWEVEKEKFHHFLTGDVDDIHIWNALGLLTRILHRRYGKSVFILVDDYDAPLQVAPQYGYYKEMQGVIISMLLRVLKDCSDTERGILTGYLRHTPDSLISGLNNIMTCSVIDDWFDSAFGFTEDEVARLLEETGLTDKADEVRKWYGGYSIGRESLYTPSSVLKHVARLLEDNDARLQAYPVDQEVKDDLRYMLDVFEADEGWWYEDLIKGCTKWQRIRATASYDKLLSDPLNLWTYYLMRGYLTLAGPYQPNGETELRIPNEEIRCLFATCVDEWFSDYVIKSDRKPLFDAIWKRDASSLASIISTYLRQTISYHDYDEVYYHAFLAGVLSGAGYIVKSNMESGEGRPDLLVLDRNDDKAAVFELKHASSRDDMKNAAEGALRQAEERGYGGDLDNYDEIIRYGVSFFKKRAFVEVAG